LERFSQLEAEVVRGPSRRTQSQCRDCFLYDLEILSDRGRVRIQVDDTTIGDSGAFELIELLRSLRDEVLHSAG
jgi:hypothetical protein